MTADAQMLEYMSTDAQILELLGRGNSTPSVIAQVTGINPQYIWQRLRLLVLQGQVRRVGRGLYALPEKKEKL